MESLTCDIHDKPITYDSPQTTAMNTSFLFRNKWGHSSTTAVTKPSIVQNWESRPISKIIKKNKHAHRGEPGNCNTAEGYARNAKPGPRICKRIYSKY